MDLSDWSPAPGTASKSVQQLWCTKSSGVWIETSPHRSHLQPPTVNRSRNKFISAFTHIPKLSSRPTTTTDTIRSNKISTYFKWVSGSHYVQPWALALLQARVLRGDSPVLLICSRSNPREDKSLNKQHYLHPRVQVAEVVHSASLRGDPYHHPLPMPPSLLVYSNVTVPRVSPLQNLNPNCLESQHAYPHDLAVRETSIYKQVDAHLITPRHWPPGGKYLQCLHMTLPPHHPLAYSVHLPRLSLYQSQNLMVIRILLLQPMHPPPTRMSSRIPHHILPTLGKRH